MYQPYSSSAHFTSSPTPSCSISSPTPLTSPSEASPALNHGKPTSPHASPAPLLLPEQGMKTENLEKVIYIFVTIVFIKFLLKLLFINIIIKKS